MRTILVLCLLALGLTLAGCGGKGNTTPEGTAQAFLAAVKSGDAGAVSKLYDYVAMARSQNSDWDSIPNGQRGLILKRVAEDRAKELESQIPQMQQTYQDAKVGTVSENGDQATVQLEGAPSAPPLNLVNRGGRWYVVG